MPVHIKTVRNFPSNLVDEQTDLVI